MRAWAKRRDSMKKTTEYEAGARRDDSKLWAECAAGSDEAREQLILANRPMVYWLAKKLKVPYNTYQDLIQEGMIGLFQAVRDYQPDKNTLFSTFANLCVVRQLCKAIEVSGRKKHKPLNAYVSLRGDDSPLLEAFDFSQQNPETIVIDRENTEQMRNKIRECLSEVENEVLDLYLEGKTYTQIAVLMEKTPKSIDNALQRIRGKIKELSLDSR